MASSGTLLERSLELAKVDLAPPHRAPALSRLVVATAVALIGSLVADALLVAIGTAIFPATKGYEHFRFFDYAALTVVGVLIACAGWPIVARFTAAPRWLFFRLAIVVTLVLFLPDVWLLIKGASIDAVGILMAMHVAIAVVTYNALVRLAPVRARRNRRRAVTAS